MTCNQLIILLDCYRGFDATRHLGTLNGDIQNLVRQELIEKSDPVSHFEYNLTNKGRNLCETILKITEL